MDEQYNTKTLDIYFSELSGDIKEIKAQTMKTNGRVNALENWSNFIKGGIAVICVLLVPILIYIVNQAYNQTQITKSVQQAVSEALDGYDVKVVK